MAGARATSVRCRVPDEPKRGTYILRPRLMALDLACVPLAAGFTCDVYLVGSALLRPDFRDVDVRVLLSPEEFSAMFPGVSDRRAPYLDPRWELLCLTMSEHLARASSLPVDFQYQDVEVANEEHGGEPRSALGMRVRW